MSDKIRISPKHGVNASMNMCCWCNQPKNIALLGKLPNDAEAPRQIITDYEPCDACAKKWESCVVIMEATHHQPSDKRPPIQKQTDDTFLYPTMRIVGIDKSTAAQIGLNVENGHRCFMEDVLFERLFGDAIKGIEKDDTKNE